MHPIGRKDLVLAELALVIAILLQLAVTKDLHVGSKYLIGVLEFLLVIGIALTAPRRHTTTEEINRTISMLLIGLISFANAGALVLVLNALLNGSLVPGHDLLKGALAIFLTNVIVFGLWYWELDSPGLTGHHKKGQSSHFQFPQQQTRKDWMPSFFDYLYVALTNGTAFSPTDTMPLTHTAKALMGTQAFIGLLTVVLVTARAVNILG